MTRGLETTNLGKRLTQKLKKVDNSLIVYIGHGVSDDSKKIQGFMSKEINNGTRVADIDIMIATSNRDVLFLVEIEESSAAPKTILGDIFSILFCDGVQVDNRIYEVNPQTKVIVGTYYKPDGNKATQFDLINERIRLFTNSIGPLDINCIQFIYEDTLSKTIDKIERMIIDEIIKYQILSAYKQKLPA